MMLAGRPPAAALVFRTLLVHGPLTRAELGRCTGLSPGAVTKVSAPLLADGWITELGRPEGSGRAAGPRRRWPYGRSARVSSASR